VENITIKYVHTDEENAIRISDELFEKLNWIGETDAEKYIILEPTESDCFEITYGDKLIFSKLRSNRIPREGEILTKIKHRLPRSYSDRPLKVD
tara:strand:- start:169 stop:450 length:282 start_codon:yes stop_codon:yes gene_type:complete